MANRYAPPPVMPRLLENTRVYNGKRQCRTCERVWERARRHRRKQ